jgi:L-fucose mutarotase
MDAAIGAVSALVPVDQAVEPAVYAMTPDGEPDAVIASHAAFARVLADVEGRSVTVAPLERSAFYERAKAAFAVVLTGETGKYACFLVTKGVVAPQPDG